MTGRVTRAVVGGGSALALAGTVHAWWNLRRLRVLPRASGTAGQAANVRKVSVLIPARDEAGKVGHCLASVRRQVDVGVGQLEILVLDDRSSDGTDQVVRQHLDDERVT